MTNLPNLYRDKLFWAVKIKEMAITEALLNEALIVRKYFKDDTN